MAAEKGRGITVSWNGTAIAGVRTKSATVANTTMDATNDDDAGIRKLLSEAGEQAVSISVSGVVVDRVLLQAALGSTIVDDVVFTYGNGNKISGSFAITSYADTGEYQGVATFEATFESAGAVTYAAS